VKRRLNTGASYRTVKIFYPPDDLKQRLATLGWRMSVRSVGQRFFYATGRRMKNNESR
jgi:demethylmenaquinone methyltransferase/2-methoxy-6-polyprenyl-1,4-benzoquinol methylase